MEQKRTTEVWRLIQQYMDGQVVPVKQAGIAQAIGVGRSSLSQWKYGQTTPTPAHLHKLHEVTRIPYQTFLDALLVDMGYLDMEDGDGSGDTAPRTRAAEGRTEGPSLETQVGLPVRRQGQKKASSPGAGHGRRTVLPDP